MSETQLELQIVSSSRDAVEALDALEQALGRVQTAISDGLKDYEDFINQMQEFSKGLNEAIEDETVEKFEKLANSLTTLQVLSRMSFDSSGIASFAEEINEIASGLNELDFVNIALKTVGPAIGNVLGNVLGHFFSSGAETIETVWNITTNIDNQNVADKADGWMIDDLLTPAIGATLAADLRNQIMATGTGSVEVPVTFTISATTGITAAIEASASGITLDDIQDAAWQSFISDLDAASGAFGSGFSISNALTAEGATVDTGLTITGKVSLAVELVQDGEVSWADKEAIEDNVIDKITIKNSAPSGMSDRHNAEFNEAVGEAVDEIAKGYQDVILEGIVNDLIAMASSPFGINTNAIGNDARTIGALYDLDSNEMARLSFIFEGLIEQVQSGLITIDDYKTALTNLVSNIQESGADRTVEETLKNIEDIQVGSPDISGFLDGMNQMVDAASAAVANISAILGSLSGLSVSFSSGRIFSGIAPIRMAANGGQFSSGEMFIARENGIPEMIGQMGNRATVANNDQIIEGISSGVASGQAEQNALLRQQNDYLRAMLNKEFTAQVVPSAALGKTVRQSTEMYARNAGV